MKTLRFVYSKILLMMLLLASSTISLAADKPEKYQLTYCGTTFELRITKLDQQTADALNPESLDQTIGNIQAGAVTTIDDLKKIQQKYRLCDWAYFKLITQLADELYGKTNLSLLYSYTLLSMSDFDCRLATTASEGATTTSDSLRLMPAIDATLYDRIYYRGGDHKYYPSNNYTERLFTYKPSLRGTKAMNLLLTDLPLFTQSESDKRTVKSEKYPEMTATFVVNRNLVDFLGTYPPAQTSDEFGSRWALLANTPLSEDLREQLYPQLQRGLKKCKTDAERVERLLNWILTGFTIASDEDVWGADRAFFSEETLFYPDSDAEDRAILFTRLVRDLVGLPCALIYYPGHLAAAVQFKETIEGKTYTAPDGSTYIVCDPTFANATIGTEMPVESIEDFDVKLIPLK